MGYLENSYTQASVINFNASVSAAGNTDEAALANKNLLVVANLPRHVPNVLIRSKRVIKVLFNNKLVVDIDAYCNSYDGFLGQAQVFIPKWETVVTDAAALAMLDRNRDSTAATSTVAASNGQDPLRKRKL